MQRLILLILILNYSATIYSQNTNDFPSELSYFKNNNIDTAARDCYGQSQKQWQIIGDSVVKEFYCGGNIHAEGLVIISQVTNYVDTNNITSTTKVFSKNGYWKVYFDSNDTIIRSAGNYKNNKQDGLWTVYYTNGSPNHEIIYVDGIIKKHTEIDETGKRTVLVLYSDTTIFIIKNESLLIFLLLFPLMLIRPFFNIITYNKVNKTNYIPMLQNWQRGGWAVGLEMVMTFWWMRRKHETKSVRNYILTANIICIISILLTLAFILLYTLWGAGK